MFTKYYDIFCRITTVLFCFYIYYSWYPEILLSGLLMSSIKLLWCFLSKYRKHFQTLENWQVHCVFIQSLLLLWLHIHIRELQTEQNSDAHIIRFPKLEDITLGYFKQPTTGKYAWRTQLPGGWLLGENYALNGSKTAILVFQIREIQNSSKDMQHTF